MTSAGCAKLGANDVGVLGDDWHVLDHGSARS
jgi:hypothetical protein